MDQFNSMIPALTFVVVMFSLTITLVGLAIAKRSTKVLASATEPWSLTKLNDDNLWLLKRNTPVIATIHGIVVEEPEHIDTPHIEGKGFHFMNPADEPTKYFRSGTTVLIRADPGMESASFILYYEEHKKEIKLAAASYHHGMKREEADILPSKVKTWTTDLY